MSYETIIYEKEEGITTITLNRARQLNAINPKLRDELIEALRHASDDFDARVVIITGGDKVFCVGADIKELPTPSRLWDKVSPKRTYSYYHLIEDMGKPVIAAIAGYCMGGGLELAMTCDLRIAADNATFSDAHSRIGVIGGAGSTQRLPRLVGIAKAKELVFTGDPIDAQEAYRIGLVNRVVPTESLMQETKKLANVLKERSPLVLKLAKACINDSMEMGLGQGLDYEAKCATVVSLTEDYKEGLRAFVEKRKPIFKGE